MKNNYLKFVTLNFLVGLSLTLLDVSNSAAIPKVDSNIHEQTDSIIT
ncbi:MAG: hypothetical protein V4594_04675 [Bacteroidota bacterium]